VICVDSPKDVQRLKLIAEELDNDTGRDVYLAFYSGLETVSQVAEQLGLTMQLVSYHVEKLLLAGLIREKNESIWISVKGKSVKHYEPSKAALLILPSLQYLKKRKDIAASTKNSLLRALSRILPEVLVPIAAFLAVFYSPRLVSAARAVATYVGSLARATTVTPSQKLATTIPTATSNSSVPPPVPPSMSSIVASVTANINSLSSQLSSVNLYFQALSPAHYGLGTIVIAILAALMVWLGVHTLRRRS